MTIKPTAFVDDYWGVDTPAPDPRPRILCLDDEPALLESLQDSLRRRFDVVATTNGFEALRMLAAEDFPVVITDMRMPLLDGGRFIALAREHAPATVRIVLSGQSTLQDTLAAVNDGQVFRYLTKPCPTGALIATIDVAVRHHRITQAEAKETAGAVECALAAVTRMLEQIEPGAVARGRRVCDRAAELAATVDPFSGAADLARAAELSQLGVLSLDADTRLHLQRGNPLRGDEKAAVEGIPGISADLLEGMPRLDGVRSLLRHQARPFEPTREGHVGTPIAARILRIALDFETIQGPGTPAAQALEAMLLRENRYDDKLLTQFSDLLGLR